jgi:hypothetical protein
VVLWRVFGGHPQHIVFSKFITPYPVKMVFGRNQYIVVEPAPRVGATKRVKSSAGYRSLPSPLTRIRLLSDGLSRAQPSPNLYV